MTTVDLMYHKMKVEQGLVHLGLLEFYHFILRLCEQVCLACATGWELHTFTRTHARFHTQTHITHTHTHTEGLSCGDRCPHVIVQAFGSSDEAGGEHVIRNNSEQASSPVIIRRQKEKLLEQYLEMFTHSSKRATRACAMNVQQNKTEMPGQCVSAGSFAASHPPLRSPRSTTWPVWRPRGSRLVQSDGKAAFDPVAKRPAPGCFPCDVST